MDNITEVFDAKTQASIQDLAPPQPPRYTADRYRRLHKLLRSYEKATGDLAIYLEKNKDRPSYSLTLHKILWDKVAYWRQKAYPEWILLMQCLAESLDGAVFL